MSNVMPGVMPGDLERNCTDRYRYCGPQRNQTLRSIAMPRLEGKIAVITGGSSGIGLATAKRFVKEGAYVFITGRRQAELDKAAAEIGSNVTAVKGDVANPNDLEHGFEIWELGRPEPTILRRGSLSLLSRRFGPVTRIHFQ